ncbi:MAG TPA: tRNA (adenosine(37)-N6)-threonylcarbamoyltransferase complex dimerization subunit type 1 TsaB [Nevskiales bacterium]|nr:tRNA (adenosine(37)-N6)-threonylcarbamoyltransferase complex dimerization subunit type 1 TsaB [Nevskiales bacterium]
MKLLALDSATEACSAALLIDDEIRERFEIAPRRHAALLLPMTQALLAEAGLRLNDLDALALAHGPGSFTGLRIALGTVQGLALGLDRPVVGISTLMALAARTQRLHGAERVAVAMDARMGQVYWGEYGWDADRQCRALAADRLLDPAQAPRLDPAGWLPAGAGWQRYAGILGQATGLGEPVRVLEPYPHAAEIARLAAPAALRGEGVPASRVAPVYLRQQVAEKMKDRSV